MFTSNPASPYGVSAGKLMELLNELPKDAILQFRHPSIQVLSANQIPCGIINIEKEQVVVYSPYWLYPSPPATSADHSFVGDKGHTPTQLHGGAV
jgi:hypothetical protein